MDKTMTTSISIDLRCNCEIRIKDDIRETPFDYEDTIGVDIVTLQKTLPQLIAEVYTTHNNNLLNEVYLPLGEDGYYEITHLILPNLNWYKKELNKQFPFRTLKDVYISNGNHIYKRNRGKLEQVDILNFTANIDLKHSTVIKYQLPYFFTCYLWKCYMHICRLILDGISNSGNVYKFINCGDCLDSIKDLIYRRNFLWATINVLNYLVDLNKFEKAQKILEEVQSCHGFCYGIDGRKRKISEYKDFNSNNSTGILLDSGCNCGN